MRWFAPMTTTVIESNQLSIPPDIAREFDIHPGTKLEWAKGEEGFITLKPLLKRGELARRLLGAGRRWLRPGVDPISQQFLILGGLAAKKRKIRKGILQISAL